ncbi:MAG TPA: hypothetical protein PLO27_05405, partial [Marmoricola sp.]|nr:hypothetical protein [Marmoricola sp.]
MDLDVKCHALTLSNVRGFQSATRAAIASPTSAVERFWPGWRAARSAITQSSTLRAASAALRGAGYAV